MLYASFARVRPDKVDKLQAWLAELMHRRAEVLESFRQEGTREEQAYLLPDGQGFVLVHITDADDSDQANAAYETSSLPIDIEHHAMLSECLAERLQLRPSYRCTAAGD